MDVRSSTPSAHAIWVYYWRPLLLLLALLSKKNLFSAWFFFSYTILVNIVTADGNRSLFVFVFNFVPRVVKLISVVVPFVLLKSTVLPSCWLFLMVNEDDNGAVVDD